MGLASIPEDLRRLYVREHLTVVHDQWPNPFVVDEITKYLTEEALWDSKDLDRLITHLHGFDEFKKGQREARLRARAGEDPPPY
jgi:hypothetical protein